MKTFILLTSIFISQSLFAATFSIIVPRDEYNLNTQNKLKLHLFEMSLECKVYSKLRAMGAPLKITYKRNDFYERFKVSKKLFRNYTVTSENDIVLEFNTNSLFNYVHACSFIANIDAELNGTPYYSRQLKISDFTIESTTHNAQIDFQQVLKKKVLKINKNTNDLSF